MHIALIGASGNIGSRIAAELLSRGHTVTGIARNPDNILSQPGLQKAQGDFTDPEQLAEVLRGHDAIISAASFLPGQAEKLLASVYGSGV